MTHHATRDSAEFYKALSKIFNISSLEVREHFSLFSKTDPLIKNCLYYLSQLEDDDLKISATLSMEFLVKFKESPFK